MKNKCISSALRAYLRAAASLVCATALAVGVSSLSVGSASAQSAQQFFGYSGGGGTSLPASCDISKLLAKNQVLLNQITQLNNTEQSKLSQIQTEQKNLKPGDTATGAALDAESQQILDSTKAQLAAIKAEQETIKKQTQTPSDQCKRDTVAQSIAEIRSEEGFITSSAPATLAKVNAEVSKIEKLEPKLQTSGVNSKDMATIKADVASVKSDSSTLKGFFAAMASRSSAFISQASADPIGTYEAMQGGGGPLSGIGNGAQGAAQNLVDSFTNLINLFDKLSGTEGQ